MPTMEPAEVMRSWFERVWNQGDDSAIDELMSPVCIAHGLAGTAGGVLKGPGEFKPFAREFRAAFPNIKIIVTRTVTEGDYCAAGCEVRGTHTGQGLGLSPTGRDVFFTGMAICRIQCGQIQEAWNSFDFLSFYQQLGIVPQKLA